eukprot:320121-Amphidinium_carterae.1
MEDTLRLLHSSSSPAGPSASPSSGMSGQRWEGQRYYADTEQDDNEPVYYEGADVDEEVWEALTTGSLTDDEQWARENEMDTYDEQRLQ